MNVIIKGMEEVFMNIWHDIEPQRVSPALFRAVVEIPKGSHCKYEMDKVTGLIRLDRVLYTATYYPANYGFIPLTFAEDNDPLDVLVLCQESMVPMTLVDCKPIGAINMVDQGYIDTKIVAVCTSDPFYNQFNDIRELPDYVGAEIRHFFQVYKTLEGKKTSVTNIWGRDRALKEIAKSMQAYQDYIQGKFKAFSPIKDFDDDEDEEREEEAKRIF